MNNIRTTLKDHMSEILDHLHKSIDYDGRLSRYAQEIGFSSVTFMNIKRRLFLNFTLPEWSEEYINKFKDYRDSNLGLNVYCKINNIRLSDMSDISLHLSYIDKVKSLGRFEELESLYNKLSSKKTRFKGGKKYKNKIKPNNDIKELAMSFKEMTLPIISSSDEMVPVVEKELIIAESENKYKNQMELIISKGVKVIIDENVSSAEVVKIIELIRNL
jgi:hypothetical protein